MAPLPTLRFSSYSALAAALACAAPAFAEGPAVVNATVAVTADADQPENTPPVEPVTNHAQEADGVEDDGDIIVTAPGASRSSVISSVPPDQVLDSSAIASYGASNLTELMAQLSTQTQSSRGRGSGMPVMLLNGRRISGRGEIRNIPPEAIEKIEIFPEEVALEYGFSADERVINVVLKQHYSALTTELEGGLATDGGRWAGQTEASWLRISGNSRLNLTANYEHKSMLTEAQRRVIQPDGAPITTGGVVSSASNPAAFSGYLGVPTSGGGTLADFTTAEIHELSPGRYRSLLPRNNAWSLDATFAQPLSQTVGFSANVNYGQSSSDSLLGLSSDSITVAASNPASPFTGPVDLTRSWLGTQALAGSSETKTFHAGATSDGRFGKWRWTVTGNADNSRSTSTTDRGLDYAVLRQRVASGQNPFAANPSALIAMIAPNTARSNVWSGDGDVTLNGPLFRMPAGQVRATLQAGVSYLNSDSESYRYDSTGLSDGITTANLSRTVWSTSSNIDIPLTSRSEGVLGAIGDVSLNTRFGYKDVSDFGGITSVTTGFNWAPTETLSFVISWVREETAPTISQLGAARLVTPLRTIFDYSRNETVLADVITGGNPLLEAERRRDFKLGANWKPFADTDLRFNANYSRTRSFNTTASFPELTPEIEAAFPDRVVRDPTTGQILSVDQTPVNFAQSFTRQIRYGITYSERIGQAQSQRRARSADDAPPPPPPGAGAPGGEGRGAGRGPGGEGRGPGGGGGPRMGAGGPPPGGGMFGGGRGSQTGRWDIGLFHTIRLENEILIRDGVPKLDLLNGSATGSNGGSSRHEVELQGGYFFRGIGARLSGTWKSGTDVIGGTANAATLHFAPQMTINARVFFDLNQLGDFTTRNPMFKNTRIRFAVDNLFNDRQEVTDQYGATPLRYQPAYMEAAGRTVSVEIRKQF